MDVSSISLVTTVAATGIDCSKLESDSDRNLIFLDGLEGALLVIGEKGGGGLDITASICFVYVLPLVPEPLKIAIVDF